MKTRFKKNRSKRTKVYLTLILMAFFSLIRNVLELIIYLLGLIIKFVYKLVFKFDSLVAKLFMKLPRLFRVAIIYLLIGLSVFAFEKPRVLVKEVLSSSIVEQVETLQNEIDNLLTQIKAKDSEIARLKVIANFNDIEKKIYNKSIENELTHEQAVLVVAISKHETGNWTSYNFKEKNNLGGLYNGSKGTFYSYESLESGIEAFVNLLKNRYFGKGLNTIEEIGNIYCPVGASNDPNGLNQYWIPKVSQYYNNYLGK